MDEGNAEARADERADDIVKARPPRVGLQTGHSAGRPGAHRGVGPLGEAEPPPVVPDGKTDGTGKCEGVHGVMEVGGASGRSLLRCHGSTLPPRRSPDQTTLVFLWTVASRQATCGRPARRNHTETHSAVATSLPRVVERRHPAQAPLEGQPVR
ncbi:hypothetical protein GCM10011314_11870 [Knoellia flava]|uniref:Uncharacterized protein n=1 Tax=Knoellia flava TaxID=913969 RepID=A0A8H9FS67_9MICO|nr:hypothetical protein GCM10011314_11870 [Knoellia flava]